MCTHSRSSQGLRSSQGMRSSHHATPGRAAVISLDKTVGKNLGKKLGKLLTFTAGIAGGALGAAALINKTRHTRSLAASFYDLVLRNTGDKDVYGSIQSADAFLARHAKHNEDFRHVARKLRFALPYTWYKETLADKAYTCVPELAHPHFSQAMQEVLVLNPRIASHAISVPDLGSATAATGAATVAAPSPKEENADDVVLYLHGGAFVLNLSEQTLGMIETLAELSGKQFVVPLYPLAPEDSYVETYAMILDVYLNLVKRHGAKHVIMAGDSAGGCLSIGLTQMLIRNKLPTPKLLVLLSPSVDNALDNPAIDKIEPLDPLLNPVGIREFLRAWAKPADLHEPHISPLFAPVEGFPPVFLSAGTHEILYPDQMTFVEKLRAANVPVETMIAPEMLHDYGMFSTPEAFTLLRCASACIKTSSLEPAAEVRRGESAGRLARTRVRTQLSHRHLKSTRG